MSTEIEWTHRPGTKGETWNPTRGCSVLSPGCTNCYAMRQAHRFSNKGGPYEGLTKLRKKLGPVWTGDGRVPPDMLETPMFWREPRTVFVNSMSDLWFDKFSNEDIAAIFGVMQQCTRHTFLILTKRGKRMREWFEWLSREAYLDPEAHKHDETFGRQEGHLIGHKYGDHDGFSLHRSCLNDAHEPDRFGVPWVWPLPNVWLGVSVENQQYADERIPELLRTPAAVRFVSYEPALGPVDFENYVSKAPHVVPDDGGWNDATAANFQNLYGYPPGTRLDWIICGGESGPGARPFDVAWARSVIEQCKAAGVACFVKQLGKETHDSARSIVGGWEPGDPEPDTRVRLKDRKGGAMAEWPEDLRVREWPTSR